MAPRYANVGRQWIRIDMETIELYKEGRAVKATQRGYEVGRRASADEVAERQ